MEIIFVEIQLLVNKMFVPGREWSRRASADVTSVSDVHAMYYWCWQTFCNISSPLHTVHKKLTIKIQISTLINNIPLTVPLPLLSLSLFFFYTNAVIRWGSEAPRGNQGFLQSPRSALALPRCSPPGCPSRCRCCHRGGAQGWTETLMILAAFVYCLRDELVAVVRFLVYIFCS